jgi:hypothetical protein
MFDYDLIVESFILELLQKGRSCSVCLVILLATYGVADASLPVAEGSPDKLTGQ